MPSAPRGITRRSCRRCRDRLVSRRMPSDGRADEQEASASGPTDAPRARTRSGSSTTSNVMEQDSSDARYPDPVDVANPTPGLVRIIADRPCNGNANYVLSAVRRLRPTTDASARHLRHRAQQQRPDVSPARRSDRSPCKVCPSCSHWPCCWPRSATGSGRAWAGSRPGARSTHRSSWSPNAAFRATRSSTPVPPWYRPAAVGHRRRRWGGARVPAD